MSIDGQIQRSLEAANRDFDGFIRELREFIGIRSISYSPEHNSDCAMAASWLGKRLENLGCTRVEIYETVRHPIVYGELPAGKTQFPTVLVYGHYDVQPPEPLGDWMSDPFMAEVRGDHLYGRGASDMKGPLLACLAAVRAMLAVGEIPVNLKFIFEGDEETAAEPMDDFLKEHGSLLKADVCLNVDSGMLGSEIPTITYGLRGSSNCTVRIFGPAQDLHDGMFGGVVQNPIHVLARLISGLQDEYGRVTLPGFYDRVRAIDPEEHALIERHPHDTAFFLSASGATGLVEDPDYLPVERIGWRPSMNVRWIEGGARKNAIPVQAEARISFRIVPDQDHRQVHQMLLDYLDERTPPSVRWEVEKYIGDQGVIVDTNTLAVRALSRALSIVWGSEPLLCRIGGSIPVVGELKEKLRIDTALTGFGLPDDNIHGPNERIHLPTLRRGIQALIHFLYGLDLEKTK